MILQALTRYYEALVEKGKVAEAGWSTAKVSYALELSTEGTLVAVHSLKYRPEGEKKEVPRQMKVPEQIKKTSGVASNFLCENGSYFLGYDNKGKPERSEQCFAAAWKIHHEILDSVDGRAANEVKLFFDQWIPEKTEENPVLDPYLDDIAKGANLIFMTSDGRFAQDSPEIRAIWKQYSNQKQTDEPMKTCPVTGRPDFVARLHPNIKGIAGAQSSGASLVSFNAPAFESYGHEQGMNAAVGEQAAFQYGAALNYLISDREHVQRIADTTIVYWVETAENVYQDIMGCMMFGESGSITLQDIRGVVSQLSKGGSVHWDGKEIRGDNRFCILGIAPNASRLSVRFFQEDTFGNMVEHLRKHNENLSIVRPVFETRGTLPLWQLLNETANQKARNRTPPAPMVGAVLLAVLQGTPLPFSLYESVLVRIRAEHDVGWKKAAILKAWFLSMHENSVTKVYKEVATVELNENSNYIPYVLGRLFAVLEKMQADANPGIKATIRDRYFTSASMTPAMVFPVLIRLSQHHQRKLSEGSRVYYDKKMLDLQSRIQTIYPDRMTLQEQGAFYLGYYHQKQSFFVPEKKEVL